jgi:AraC-like DNA-binding protein
VLEFRKHGYRQFRPTQLIGPAKWPHFDLLFVHRGTVAMDFPGLSQALILAPQSGLLIWPNTHFQGRVVGRRALVSIQHFAVLASAREPFDRLLGKHNGFNRQAPLNGAWVEQCVRRALAMAEEEGGEADHLSLRRSLLHLILMDGGYLSDLKQNQAERIDKEALTRWLVTQLADNPGIPELAQWVGLSPSRFRTIFLQEHGLTAGRYLSICRMREAKRLLAETDEPIKAIATAIGYADAVVFHRAFKLRVGQTPAVYRREFSTTG